MNKKQINKINVSVNQMYAAVGASKSRMENYDYPVEVLHNMCILYDHVLRECASISVVMGHYALENDDLVIGSPIYSKGDRLLTATAFSYADEEIPANTLCTVIELHCLPPRGWTYTVTVDGYEEPLHLKEDNLITAPKAGLIERYKAMTDE